MRGFKIRNVRVTVGRSQIEYGTVALLLCPVSCGIRAALHRQRTSVFKHSVELAYLAFLRAKSLGSNNNIVYSYRKDRDLRSLPTKKNDHDDTTTAKKTETDLPDLMHYQVLFL